MASHPTGPIPPPYQPIMVNSFFVCLVSWGYIQRGAEVLRSQREIIKK